ncbi:MAG: hypothetical protein JO255_02750 [Alphaproteobacteria bacterium]|nr:hypothetical protein [Alphaproteobacteria bacterium]
MSTPIQVRVRLQLKSARLPEDIGVKTIDRDPVRGAQLKFEHDGRVMRARVVAISRLADDRVGSVEVIEV